MRARVGVDRSDGARGSRAASAHVQVGGDLTELLERGGARRRAERGRRLRGCRGDALGARARRDARAREQGEPRRGRRARARGAASGEAACCCRSTREHSALHQCLEGRSAGDRPLPRPDRLGRPVPRPQRAPSSPDVTVEDALAHPTWSMGPKITVDSATLANKGLELIEAHFLFGIPYERIEVVVHPSSIVHALVRFRDGAALAHLGYPDMSRADLVRAHAIPSGRATDVPQLDLAAGLTLEFEAPDLETFPLLALARRRRASAAGRTRASTTRRTRWRWPRSSTGGCRSSAIAEVVEERSTRPTGSRRATSPSSSRRTRAARRHGRARSAGRVNVFISIVGLGLPDPDPRGGALLRRPRRRHEPAEVLHRVPAGGRRRSARNGIEYGIGAIPLGGYVKIPGMHRPGRGRPRHVLRPRRARSSPGSAGTVELLRRRLTAERLRRCARGGRAPRAGGRREPVLSPLGAQGGRARHLARSAMRSARMRTGARRRGSASPSSSPARARTSCSQSCSSRRCSWPAAAGRPGSSTRSWPGTPAAAAGLRAGDEIVNIGGYAGRRRTRSPSRSASPAASRSTIVVERGRSTVTLGPVRPRKIEGDYRLGFVLAARGSARSSRRGRRYA